MPVEESSGRTKETARRVPEDMPRHRAAPTRARTFCGDLAVSPICQSGLRCAPAILESDEAGVVPIRPSQIEFPKSVVPGILDYFPKYQVCTPEVAEPLVGATILVNDRGFVSERQDARYGLAILGSYVDFHFLAQACDQIAEPSKRLGQQQLPPASQHQQVIELLKQRRRRALFVNQSFALRP